MHELARLRFSELLCCRLLRRPGYACGFKVALEFRENEREFQFHAAYFVLEGSDLYAEG